MTADELAAVASPFFLPIATRSPGCRWSSAHDPPDYDATVMPR
jgi:hypothetical protein